MLIDEKLTILTLSTECAELDEIYTAMCCFCYYIPTLRSRKGVRRVMHIVHRGQASVNGMHSRCTRAPCFSRPTCRTGGCDANRGNLKYGRPCSG